MSNSDQPLKEHNSELQPSENEIPEELKPLIEDPEIPETKRKQLKKALVEVSIKKAMSFSGPIPPPELLEGYNKVINNGAERIIIMAEKQSNHRIDLENFAIKEGFRQSGRGQIFGFILGIIGLGLATTLALFGHETIAGIFGTTTILGLVTVFVIGKKIQKKDLEEKE